VSFSKSYPPVVVTLDVVVLRLSRLGLDRFVSTKGDSISKTQLLCRANLSLHISYVPVHVTVMVLLLFNVL
jgi:phage host-nuclease inhibitor protein Gam